jgi:exopolysaccharide biosynthesis protein
MLVKAARTVATSRTIAQKFKNFVNGNFFYHSTIIGWLISEGKIISRRDEYKTWKGNPKGTLMVMKDGTVRCGLMLDSEIAPLADAGKIWFCCQGFNLFPCNIAREGFTDNSIARTCNRIAIGYNPKNFKIYITARPLSNWQRAIKTMENLGCSVGICLDSGASANMYVNGKALMKTSAVLTNIVYWN